MHALIGDLPEGGVATYVEKGLVSVPGESERPHTIPAILIHSVLKKNKVNAEYAGGQLLYMASCTQAEIATATR